MIDNFSNIHIPIFETLGDVLMITPIVRAIRQKYQQAHIFIYTKKEYISVWDNNPNINKVVECNNYSEFWGKLIRQDNIPDIICPIAMRDHYDTLWHHLPEMQNSHMIDMYASRLPKELEIEVPIKDKHIDFFGINDDVMMKMAAKYGIINHAAPSIILHTTSRVGSKDWPIEHWQKLIRLIDESKLFGTYNYIQIGSPNDKPIIDNKLGFNHVYKDNLSLAETADMIRMGWFYVGVDSGPAYLAEAMNKRAYLIMGATMGTPQLPDQKGPFVGPVSDKITYIEPNRPNHPLCRPVPCVNHCQLEVPCISTITPEQVFDTIVKTESKLL